MGAFDLGPGILVLLTLVVTVGGGLLTLWINLKFKGVATATNEIHTLVNSRLTKVLDENAEFKSIIVSLLASKDKAPEERLADRARAQDKLSSSESGTPTTVQELKEEKPKT